MPPEGSSITVLLVDDHVLVAEGLAALLDASGDIRVVGTATSCARSRGRTDRDQLLR